MAENFDHIDQIIRQKFENFEPEPPVKVWENIRTQISENPPPSASGFMMPIIVALSLLVFLSGLIHYFTSPEPADLSLNADLSEQVFISPDNISTGSTTTTDESMQTAFYQADPDPILQVRTFSAATVTPEVASIPVRDSFSQEESVSSPKRSKKVHQTALGKYVAGSRQGQWKPGLRQTLAAGELSYADAVYYNLDLRDIKKLSGFKEYTRKFKADWSVGVYFHPEITRYEEKSLENTVNYSLSILPQMTYGRFFVQGGVSIRQTHDKGDYAIDYNRYLGSYEDVYLVTFDSTENGVIPTYFTETVEVFDTIDHYAISETRANYTYLDVPLLAGYRQALGRVSFVFKAGPAASFVLVKNLPPPGNPEEKAKIINVDYQVPARSVINWQIMLGAGIEYQLSSKLYLGMEPTFRFAMNPEYQLPANAGWRSSSFGVRAGLRYNF